MRYDLYVTFLDGLPIHAHPPEEVGRFMDDARECAKGRQRSQSGPEAAAWLRARPKEATRIIPAQGLLHQRRRHMGIEEYMAATCPSCGAADANTRHTRLYHRASAKANQTPTIGPRDLAFAEWMSVCH